MKRIQNQKHFLISLMENKTFVTLELKEKVAVLTIDRPTALNALNATTITQLSEALDQLSSNKDCRVVIITGSGEKAFVAGADIKEFSDFNSSDAQKLSVSGQEKLFSKIENFSKPVIAAINGFALGGGLELALSCHIRYASENAKLGLPEVTLGLIPGYGGTQRLPKLVGKGLANEMIFSAKMISAQEAEKIGLVNKVTPLSDLISQATELAQTIAKNSPMAIEKAIKAVNLSDTQEGYNYESTAFGELFEMEDKEEGVSAFLEKRKPQF